MTLRKDISLWLCGAAPATN
ncbi:hypothetical protein LINPERHAP1_LOCUS35097 [Linum perenne]